MDARAAVAPGAALTAARRACASAFGICGAGGACPARTAGRARAACAAALLLACAAATAAHAGVLRYCDEPAELSAAQQDTLFRFSAIIKAELERAGQRVALIARSGTDLGRFGQRYSHAGVSLQDSANAPWSVRQLYYDCDEGRPRLFDQGMAGFVFGTADPAVGHVSVVLLPEAAATALARVVKDDRQALRLLGTTYSANAYAFGHRYQNCNQWVAEALAVAWGGLGESADLATDPSTGPSAALRADAQGWLQARGYAPAVFEVGNPLLMALAGLLPWLHTIDHPQDDLRRQRFVVSMPASIEAFVRDTVPGARRIEFCHAARQVVVRHGWEPMGEGCTSGAYDTVIPLD